MIHGMTAVCPRSPSHTRFSSTAVVSEVWVVDQKGHWVETLPGESQVMHEPTTENPWICLDCGETAAFLKDTGA